MPKGFVTLAWTAVACAYLLIVLGAVVRITGSGMGCGDHWPLCNGHLFPSLNDIPTVIEWSHRLVAAVVSILVIALVVLDWRRAWPVLALLILQVLLGAVTVKTGLTPVLVILHLATAMLLLAALIVSARGVPGPPPGLRRGSAALLALTFITVLFGALTANLGAIASCGGFPLCNGQLIPTAGPLAWVHWTHRLLAYTVAGYLVWWVVRSMDRRAWGGLLAIVVLQIAIAATMIQLGFPGALQAAHAAVGAGVWAMVVIAAVRPATNPAAAAAASPRGPILPDIR
jgi:heme a synthase